MTTATTTSPPAAALDDVQAATILTLALHSPAGVTAPTAAAALDHTEHWVLWQTGSIPGVLTIGPDLRTGHPRYQAAGPVTTPQALLAGALLALTERGWSRYEIEDNDGRVDVLGAIALADHRHPYDDPSLLALAAADELALALDIDPARVDPGQALVAYQHNPTTTLGHVQRLILRTLGVSGIGR